MRIQHFNSIDDVVRYVKADVPENPFPDENNSVEYEWVIDGDKGRLVPSLASSFWSPFLYRGQVTRHSPCLPGVFRGLPLVDHPQGLSSLNRAKCFLARVRLGEFLLALEDHPACEYSNEIGLTLSREALAQHYELATDRIDLTQDPDVAAFFAVNARTHDGCWHPMTDGSGVLYRLHFPSFARALRSRRFDLEWVGKQVLPRPGEQKAWTLRLPLGRDFEKLPVEVLTFSHQASSSERINAGFDQGRLIFPPDPLAEVAEMIKESGSVPRTLVSRVLTMQGCPSDLRQRELDASVEYFANELGIAVVDRAPMAFSPKQRAAARSQVDQMKKNFLDDVGIRAARSGQPRTAQCS
jgi:hypothetical protein